jgi:mandelate racemase
MQTSLRVQAIRTEFVKVPMRFPLGTSAATVTSAPLLLVDLQTDQGVVGRSYLFCYRDSGARAIADVLHEAAELIHGQPIAPTGIAAFLSRRYALLGVTGVVRMALSAIDMACWDALGLAANQPLAKLLGAGLTPIRAYNSDGLGLMPAREAAAQATRLVESGFTAIKLRLGHGDPRTDLEVATAVRGAIGSSISLMVDYNQALSVPEALARANDLAPLNIYWLEEQLRHDDLRGYAELAEKLEAPVQLGENLNGPEDVEKAVAARAGDLLMLDVGRIGGVTGWQQAVKLAGSAPISSHLVPEVSAHLLAATPSAHWLEYVSWADAILREPMQIVHGFATPSARPGLGLDWSDSGVAKYRVR